MLSPMDGPTNGVPVEAPARIKVLLVDDHAVVRRGLRGFFELLDDIEVVGEAEDGQRAVELVGELEPDVVLMDLLMPVMDGIAATAEIKARYPDVEVVALTSFIEEDRVTPPSRPAQPATCSRTPRPTTSRSPSAGRRPARCTSTRRWPAARQPDPDRATGRPREPLTEREREVLSWSPRATPTRRSRRSWASPSGRPAPT